MKPRPGESRIRPGWWTAIFLAAVVAAVALTAASYTGSFTPYTKVTLTSDRAGLIMEPGSKVMLSGIQVGHVRTVSGGRESVSLDLDIDRGQIGNIPANVGAQIRATTAFGAKYVDLIYPEHPVAGRLSEGAILHSQNVTTEVNTVFQNLVGLLDQVDPMKLNAVLSALSEGFRGQGERIGTAITDANQVLLALNPRSETVRRDWMSFKDFSDTYASAADDIVSILDATSTTGATLTGQATALDSLLLNTIGFGQDATTLLVSSKNDLIESANLIEPTTALLLKYNPELTCTLVGAKTWVDNGGFKIFGGNGRTFVADATILGASNPYVFPDNLPIVAAKGGPGGKPGCGSLPDPANMYPVRQLITNTGWGTGLDIRPNPGVATPCYANYLPATRAVPQPPSIRKCLPGPAPGPVTAQGMPPYGAGLYGPGGVPLWPGLPAAAEAPPPVPVPGTPVAPGKIPAVPAPPAVMGAPPPPGPPPAIGVPPASSAPLNMPHSASAEETPEAGSPLSEPAP